MSSAPSQVINESAKQGTSIERFQQDEFSFSNHPIRWSMP
jgi:hypothetical protein